MKTLSLVKSNGELLKFSVNDDFDVDIEPFDETVMIKSNDRFLYFGKLSGVEEVYVEEG